MAAVGDDCYFFYTSSCKKGPLCPFRHCEVARGNEAVCSLWQAGVCFRPNCKFRHMKVQMDRSQVPCYWESQPAGCSRPHCAFKHTKPRVLTSTQPPTSSTGNGAVPSAPSGQEEVQQTSSSGHSSPIVQPVIIPMEDSDVESVGTVSSVGTPLKSRQRSSVSPNPTSVSSVVKQSSAQTSTRQSASPPQTDRLPQRSKENRLSNYKLSPSRFESSPPPRREVSPPPKREVSPSPRAQRNGREARCSPVRTRPVPITERLGNRTAVSDAPRRLSPALGQTSGETGETDESGVEVLSLEEIHRRRALESMMRAREQKAAAAAQAKHDSPVEHEDPQVDCRRVVVDSEEPEERDYAPQTTSPKKARVSVRERLGARVSPKKALKTKKRRPAPAAVSEETSEDDTLRAAVRRRTAPASVSPYYDSEEELDAVPFRKRKAPVSDSESEEETLIVIKKKKTSAAAPVKAEEASDEEPIPKSLKKRRPAPAVEVEEFSEEEEPISITFIRDPEEEEPVKVASKQGARRLKKKLAERVGSAAEQKHLKKKIVQVSASGIKPRHLKIRSAENNPEPADRIPVMKRVQVEATRESAVGPKHVKKLVGKEAGEEEKKKKKVVNDVLAERRRLKKLMADHLRPSAVEKPKRKITLVTDQEEESDNPKRPKALSLEEIRQRKKLKKPVTTGDSSESASDSEKEKSTVPILSLLEIRQRKQQKQQEARPQPVYDISLFTDRGGWNSKSSENSRVLSLEEIRQQKLKRHQGQTEESTKGDLGSLKSANKKTAPASAKRSKAEVQIYVPPARKNAVKMVSVSPPPKEAPAVKKRLGKPAPIRAPAEEKQEGGSCEVKTFSEIMAEKKRRRLLEKQQQNKKSDQQETGNRDSKRPFSFRPVVFGEGEENSLSNSPKRMAVSGPNKSEEITSPLNKQSKGTAQVNASRNFSFAADKLGMKKDLSTVVVSKGSSPSPVKVKSWSTNLPQSTTSRPVTSGKLTAGSFISKSSRTDSVVKPLHHSSSMPVISSSVQSGVSFSSPTRTTPRIPSASRPPNMAAQQNAVTPVAAAVKSSVSPLPQPARQSATPPAPQLPSSNASPSVSSSSVFHPSAPSIKSPTTNFRRMSSNLSVSHLLDETPDDLLLPDTDSVTLDDTDQLDDLLMDIDSLLE